MKKTLHIVVGLTISVLCLWFTFRGFNLSELFAVEETEDGVARFGERIDAVDDGLQATVGEARKVAQHLGLRAHERAVDRLL